MMKNHIVVVGGYGHVGQSICKELGELFPGMVYAAGRSFERSERFSQSTGGKVRPLQLDINEKVDAKMLENVKLVIMCLDQKSTAFVQQCLENGIHYMDITADYSFLSQVEQLHTVASGARATAVLSVGLAPGLTNLLARSAKNLLDKVDVIDIFVMLGLGDRHGKAAIEWTINNLGVKFDVIQEGVRIEVASFTDGIETDFGEGIGRKKAYRFNFSDQHSLSQTLGVASVSTRLCFDSTAATKLLTWLRASGAFRLLKLKCIRQFIVQLFGKKMRLGQEIFAVKIDAWGKKGGDDVFVESFVQGKQEAVMTAKIATAVATIVYSTSLPHGVFHIEQLFELENILDSIQKDALIQTRVNSILIP